MTIIIRIAILASLGAVSACGGHASAPMPYTTSTYAAPGYERGIPNGARLGSFGTQNMAAPYANFGQAADLGAAPDLRQAYAMPAHIQAQLTNSGALGLPSFDLATPCGANAHARPDITTPCLAAGRS